MPNRVNLELSLKFQFSGVAPSCRAGNCCEFYCFERGELLPPASFSLQLLCSWLTAREFYGIVGPDPAAAHCNPKPSLERRAPSRAGRGAGWPLTELPAPALQGFSSHRVPALEVLHFILFIKLMLGRRFGSAGA